VIPSTRARSFAQRLARVSRSRWARGLAVVVLVLVVWRIVRPRLYPAPASPDATTLAHVANVRVLRDVWGVAHVFGESDADAAFGLAYAHAEDDWPTIQGVLAAARGRLSLLTLSKQALANDYYVALIRVAEQTDAQYPTLSPELRAVLEAYARGLNYYAYIHPREADGRLLPFTGKDVAAGFVHKLPVLMGFAGVLSELLNHPPASVGDALPPPPAGAAGSNAHAVHRSRAADDITRLNVNSHQPWEGPVAWYEAHVHSEEGWNMTGGTFPGAPFILHGHNDNLGWAHTVNAPDLVDVYKLTMRPESLEYLLDGRWVPLDVSQAKIEIDTGFFTFTAEKTVYRSAHGPVMETDQGFYALRYAGEDRTIRASEQWFRMNKSRTLAEWKAAMRIQGVPQFNTVYADRDNIYYIYNALLPLRADGHDYTRVLPGDRSDLIWQGYLPFEDLPHVENPRSGFVQNCNSTPFQTTIGGENPRAEAFAEAAGIERIMTNRALRSIELFGAPGPIGRDDFLRFKWDRTYAREARIWKKLIEPVLATFQPVTEDERQAIELLRGWDGRADEGSAASAVAIAALRYLADEKQAAQEDTDPAIALRRAIALLRGTFGRVDVPLGELMRLRRGAVDLPLGGGPDLLNAVYTKEKGGKLVAYQGDSYVLIVEFTGGGAVSSSVHHYGSSNRPSSPHYADQAPLFVRRELKKALRAEADVRAHMEREYRPGEEASAPRR
jgi:penicillin amidase/acyl-homoserine-lactone acylase